MTSARARTRDALQELVHRLRARHVVVDVGVLHLLREFGAHCYEVARTDVHSATTVPAPAPDDDTQYTINYPRYREPTP